ncbi:MAG: Mut7-C RNAse domain-containing protein [Desulfosarcinaceae bacterium]|jgi:uncharacterized protein with PIN domain
MSKKGFCFAVDASLGRLAKHLRLMGFNAAYQDTADAMAFFRHAGPDRIALTRIRQLCGRLPQDRWLYIRSNDPEAQVAAVLTGFKIEADDLRPFSRCIRCNEVVVPLKREASRGRVPEHVWQTQPSFSGCPCCGRIYWPGSHTQRYRRKIKYWFNKNTSTHYEK